MYRGCVSNFAQAPTKRRGRGRGRARRGSGQASERKPEEEEARRAVYTRARNPENRGHTGLSCNRMLVSRASEYITFCVTCSSVSAFLWVSCVVLAPPAGHRIVGSVFCSFFYIRFSGLLLLLIFFRAFRLVLSCRPSVGPSGHIMGLIVPANSNLVPSGFGLRPERIHYFIGFVFLSFVYFHFLSFSFLFTPPLALFCPSSFITSSPF